ncbi:hypothetical protein VV01_22005 [Luteipulveratus halotolerans]|uniref:ParB-like N-terminal domain-containing protein n=1 Tax=Luteipulveratus halotolerans TaxID=1631356 RepID=A0A0L6CDN9_9MICO|nr:hypothetical protein VV01_22005 [Luteipulveratus halotolerans]
MRDAASHHDEATTRIPLEDIAPYPHNPAWREDGTSEKTKRLADSIGEVGVLQPILVVSAADYLKHHPEDREAIADRPWVTPAGVRRLTASRLAGKEDIPATVRPELAAQIGLIPLHENDPDLRLAFTPLEEARQMQRAMDEQGLSQRKLAEHLGRAQGQISKRLALLTLPASAQEALESEAMLVTDAPLVLEMLGQVDLRQREEVVAAFDERLRSRCAASAEAVRKETLMAFVREARNEIGQRRARREAQEVADREGLRVIEPGKTLGVGWQEHRLTDAEAIEQAREQGDLAVAVSGEDTVYFRVSPPPATAARAAERKAARDEQAEARKAAQAREQHLVTVLAVKPKAGELVATLADGLLRGRSVNGVQATLARTLAQGAGVGPSAERTQDDYEWKQLAQTHAERLHLAWISAVAAQEVDTRAPHHTWGAADCDYLAWLTDRGYVPTPWEKDQLAAARTRTDDSVPTSPDEDTETTEQDDPQTDSVESAQEEQA